MKLNVRLILITSIIILVISVVSTYIYYSLAGGLFSRYQYQSVLNSTNDFIFALQESIEKADEDFQKLAPHLSAFNSINIDSTSIDFIFTVVNDTLINPSEIKVKSDKSVNTRSRNFQQFFADNPSAILEYSQMSDGRTIYYGYLASQKLLDDISQKIRAEVALVINDSPVEISNTDKNQKYLLNVVNSVRSLKFKNNFDIYSEQLETADFVSSLFTPRLLLTPGGKINFVIFNPYKESVDFRNDLRTVMILLVIAGAAITIILVLITTARLRKQISFLSEAAEMAGKGNFEYRVTVITKDEIGTLGNAFNRMLEVLEQKEKAEKEYTEFITLINQNPSIHEISESALSKIIKSTGLTFGVLYLVEQKKLRLISSYGVSRNLIKPTQDSDFYSNAIEKKEIVEFSFKENFPEIKTGLAIIKIKYLLVFPVIYNKETIAILELASESIPEIDIKSFIGNIQEQLAVGLTNAVSLEQLENLVLELRRLNEEYQKQNQQIVEQNQELKNLHKQLQEKANELEGQRAKAIELTKVKSQFLASMSHELRTPLISILGLTELMMKDSNTHSKSKERLNVVFRNGKKLLGLITNILEFSKFESGKIEIKKESFLFSDLIDELKPNIEHIASEKKLRFVLDLPKGKNLLLSTDKSKLDQILTNLLVNAVKFTETGEVKLAITLSVNNRIDFRVSDSGIGISEENKKMIFSEFRQIENGIDRKFGGAGLGLAICKRYVELLGGEINVDSEPGKGSVFHFSLDDIVLDVIDTEGYSFLKVEVDEEIHAIEQNNALIVGKDQNTNKFIGDYLKSYSYQVFTAESKDHLLNLVEDQLFKTIIINPDLLTTGFLSLVSKLKNNAKTNETQIISLMILQKEKLGWMPNIFDYLFEPLNNTNLKTIINNFELSFHKRPEKIYLISFNLKDADEIKNFVDNTVRFELVTDINEFLKHSPKDNASLVLVDIESLGGKSIDLCYQIKQKKLHKNIGIILFGNIESAVKYDAELINEIEQITLKVKNHPLDVLKDLKDRLMLDDNSANKKLSLLEEVEKPIAEEIYKGDNSVKPTILVVDDDSDSLFTVGEYLKEIDCEVMFAHNGMECILMLNHLTPDLILLDIMMPQMDGFETIKRIRSNDKFFDLPVIALTAYAMLDNKHVIEKNGFNDLVTKPINFKVLESKIKSNLKVKIN
ncbi:MAG: response regulator [Bacteroidota bacterium]